MHLRVNAYFFFSKLGLLRHLTLVWPVELVLNPAVDPAVLLQRSHPTILLEVRADGRCVCSVALNYLSSPERQEELSLIPQSSTDVNGKYRIELS